MNEYVIKHMREFFEEIAELHKTRIFFNGYPNKEMIEGGHFSETIQIGNFITKQGGQGVIIFNIRTGKISSGLYGNIDDMEDFELKENWIDIIEDKYLELQNRYLEKQMRIISQMAEIQDYVEYLRNNIKEDELEELEEIEDFD